MAEEHLAITRITVMENSNILIYRVSYKVVFNVPTLVLVIKEFF